MTEHTNKQFDADLENVRSQFLQMGGVVEAMIQEAIDALASGDMALVDKVREREKEVNRHEVEIDEHQSHPGPASAHGHRPAHADGGVEDADRHGALRRRGREGRHRRAPHP